MNAMSALIAHSLSYIQPKEKRDELLYYQEEMTYEMKDLSNILKPCEKHNLKETFHPTDADLSQFASIVYKKPEEIDQELRNNNLQDWSFISYGSHTDSYFGAAFYNAKKNQLVISHQGTGSFKDLITDVQGVLRGQITSQIRSACSYCALVLEDFDQEKVHISFTGHSLGAWLAQITTFTCEYLQLNEKDDFVVKNQHRNYNIHTVIFDSPGCYEMLCTIFNYYYPKYEKEPDYMISDLDITIYFKMPNFINSANSHRHTNRLLQIYTEEEIIKYSSWRDTSTHNMDRFVEMMRDESSKILTVLNWPSFSFPQKTNKKTSSGPSSYLFSLEVIKVPSYAIKQLFFSEENELKEFIKQFQNCNKKGTYDILIEMNDKKIRYEAKEYDGKTRRVSAFSFDELNFLRFWEKFEKLNLANETYHSNLHDISLPKFEIRKENEKEIISCDSKEDLARIINYVKNLYCNKPSMHEIVKGESAKIPEIYECYYDVYSNNYLKKLPTYDIDFTDTIELHDFLNQKSNKKIFCLVTKQKTTNEVFRIRKLLQSYKKEEEQCYLSLIELCELERRIDISKVFENRDITIDKYLVIDCSAQENYKDTGILKKLINFAKTCQNKKKLILVSNERLKGCDESKCKSNETISYTLSDFDEESKRKLLNKLIKILSFENKEIRVQEFFGEKLLNDFFKKQPNVINYLLQKEFRIPDLNSKNIANFDEVKIRTLKVYEDIENDRLKEFLAQTVKDDKIFFATSGGSLKNRLGAEIDENRVNGNPEDFYVYCQKINKNFSNSEKYRIYWLHLSPDPKLIEIREVFVSNLYINRYFHPQIIIYEGKLLEEASSRAKTELVERELFEIIAEAIKNRQTPFEFKLSTKEHLRAPYDRVSVIKNKWVVDFNTEPVITSSLHHSIRVEKTDHKYKLIWKASSGSVKEIRNLVFKDYSVELTESQFREKDESLVIIADEPGMGKSTALLHIASNMKNKWIIWVSLIKVRAEIPDVRPDKLNLDIIIKFLQITNKNLSNPVISSMLKYGLSKSNSLPIVFFFDGFDEIDDETARKNMIKIFKFIKEETNAKLWITTRDWAKSDLEEALLSFAIKMKEMTEEEQLSLITNIWESRLMTLKKDQCQLKMIAQDLLDQVEKVLVFDRKISNSEQNYLKKKVDKIVDILESFPNREELSNLILNNQWPRNLLLSTYLDPPRSSVSHETWKACAELRYFLKYSQGNAEKRFIYKYFKKKKTERNNSSLVNDFFENTRNYYNIPDSKKDISFIGIPMQIRMIADVAQPYSNSPEERPEVFNNFYNMYKEFSSKKIKIYFKEKLGKKVNPVYEESLVNKHECLGFQLLFPKEAEDLLDAQEILKTGIDKKEEEIGLLNDIGLVQLEYQNSKIEFQFVHYSFAEYCAAGKILRFLQRMGKNIWTCEKMENLVKEKILKQPKYNTLRRFLSDFLEDSSTNIFCFLKKEKVCKEFESTPLYIAVEENNEALAKILLDSYDFKEMIDVRNNQNDFLEPLLHTAIETGSSYELVKKIIDIKSEISPFEISIKHEDYPDSNLYVVLYKHGIPLVRIISINGSNYKEFKGEATICGMLKESELTFTTESKFKILLKILTSEPDIFQIIVKKKSELYEELIRKDRDWINTMFCDATSRHRPEIVKHLIERGADVNKGRGGLTPLIFTLHQYKWDFAEMIIDHPDVDVNAKSGDDGKTAIQIAAERRRIDFILKLLKKGANIDDIKDKLELTEIGIAVLKNDSNKVRELIQNPDTNLNVSIFEITLLQAAVINNGIHVVTELLKREEIKKDIDKTFIYWKHNEIFYNFRVFKSYGAFHNPSDPFTPLQYAIFKGFKEIANTLLDHGAKVNITAEKFELTALHRAVEVGDYEMVKRLIEKGSNINAKAKNGVTTLTPIQLSAYRGRWDIAKLLLEKNADPKGGIPVDAITKQILDVYDGNIETVLSLAQAAEQTEVLKMLRKVASSSNNDMQQ